MSRNRLHNDAIGFFPDLPPGWREERIHDVLELRTSNVDKKSEEGEEAVRLCNYVDVYKNDKITLDLDFMEATATEAQLDRFALRVGDVVITKDSETPDDIGVPALIAETAPDLVCGYHLTILRPNEKEVVGGYLFYAVASRLSAYQFYLAANGVTRFGITYQGTKNLRIALPSVPEQQRIAAFLDWKTDQIDTLIARKQQLLEMLMEKRLAVINQAVTRGLNPDAPLRDSGISWLGQVPRHWEVGGFTKYIEDRADYRGKTPEKVREGVFLVTAKNIKDGTIDYEASQEFVREDEYSEIMSRGLPRVGDLLFTTEAPLGEVANVDKEDIALAQRVIKFRGEPLKLNNYFAKFWMMSGPFQGHLRSLATGSTALGIKASKLFALRCVVPPLDEQRNIVAFLDKKQSDFSTIDQTVSKGIARLTEYRAALITAATTGKIDVRSTRIPRSVG
jgi:type I restriction enzyme, S subunit